MDYRIDREAHQTTVFLRGRLTFNDHSVLRAMIREMSLSDPGRQVLDLSALEFVDSAGIGMLLIAREEMANVEKDLVLRKAAGQVKRVLTVAQLGKLVTIEE